MLSRGWFVLRQNEFSPFETGPDRVQQDKSHNGSGDELEKSLQFHASRIDLLMAMNRCFLLQPFQ